MKLVNDMNTFESDTKAEAEYIYYELIKSVSLLDYDRHEFCKNVVNKLNVLIIESEELSYV